MTDGPPDPEEARDRLLEEHDLERDAEEAHELLDEAVALWDELDHSGRVARLRQAGRILDRTLERNRMRMERDTEADSHCLDCGSTDTAREDIGHGQQRVYCTNCDATLQVG